MGFVRFAMFGNDIKEIFYWVNDENISNEDMLLYLLYGCCYDKMGLIINER